MSLPGREPVSITIPRFDPAVFSYLKVSSHSNRRAPPRPRRQQLEATGDEARKQDARFELFPQLPLELRRAIWVFAAREPRVVETHFAKLHAWYTMSNSNSIRTRKQEFGHIRSHTAKPPLLLACQESRDVALSLYTNTDLRDGGNCFCADVPYYERAYDIMFHASINHGNYGRQELRSLAIDVEALIGTPRESVDQYLVRICFLRHHLEEIIVVGNAFPYAKASDRLSKIRLYEIGPDDGAVLKKLQPWVDAIKEIVDRRMKFFETYPRYNNKRDNFDVAPVVRTMVTRLRYNGAS